MKRRLILFLGLTALLLSCNSGIKIDSSEFNNERWKADRNACEGGRSEIVEDFREVKDRLLGARETAIVRYLGKPDYVDLSNRHDKYYVYYVTAGKQCGQGEHNGAYFRLHFTPMNIVREVSYHHTVLARE